MITQERLKELFDYRDGFLYWKESRRNQLTDGQIAGHKTLLGYWKIRIDRKDYQAHRMIFLYHHGHLPKELDHIDRNTINNRIENLREVSHHENSLNRKCRSDSKTGVKNVSLTGKGYEVSFKVKGKRHNFGTFNDLELAKLVAQEARIKLHGTFANHG